MCDVSGFESDRMELLRHVSFVDCPGEPLPASADVAGSQLTLPSLCQFDWVTDSWIRGHCQAAMAPRHTGQYVHGLACQVPNVGAHRSVPGIDSTQGIRIRPSPQHPSRR